MRVKLLREAAIATLILIAIVFLVSRLSLKSDFLRPIRQGIGDFDVYDLFYSGKDNQSFSKKHPDIIIIQSSADREKIARQIGQINELYPTVLGIDLRFDGPREPASDAALKLAMGSHPENVAAYSLGNTPEGGVSVVENFLDTGYLVEHGGYVNFAHGDSFAVIRRFNPFFGTDRHYSAFTSRILEKYDPEKYKILQDRNHREEDINYQGGLNYFENYTEQFFDSLYNQVKGQKYFWNKIVLLGSFSKDELSPKVLDDLKYTPMNSRFHGKGFPDTYGIVVHANILAMELKDKQYIHVAGNWVSFLFSFVFVMITMYLVFWFHFKYGHPLHIGLLLLQLATVILSVWFFLKLHEWFNWKVNLVPIIVAIVLSIEMYDLYARFAAWLHKKNPKYQTVFGKH